MRKIIWLALIAVFISGCATTTSAKRLSKVELDCTKEEVTRRLGEPTVVRGAIKNKFGQSVEVWEYRMDKGKTGRQIGQELAITLMSFGFASPILMSEGEVQNYWLYFYDNKLVQWGQAGDWSKEADRIYNINFDSEQKLTR